MCRYGLFFELYNIRVPKTELDVFFRDIFYPVNLDVELLTQISHHNLLNIEAIDDLDSIFGARVSLLNSFINRVVLSLTNYFLLKLKVSSILVYPKDFHLINFR